MGRKYGISTISLVPYSLGARGFVNSLEIVQELRLDGIQALPMRGWSADKYYYAGLLYEPWDKMILSFEEPWNYGSVREALARTLGSKEEGYPTFLDLFLFGRNPIPVLTAMEGVFGRDKDISHTLGFGMVEINLRNIKDINYKRGRLVWDTWHAREEGMPDWRSFLSALLPKNIKMIHFHPKDENELDEFIMSRKNELADMLHALRLKVSPDCPVILETRPKIGQFVSRKSMIKRLHLIRDAVFDILG